MTTTAESVGDLLRAWRQRRRYSQLDLAGEAGVSTRHLSFVETGRASASREMLVRLAEQLGMPLRARNRLLLAGGFAPAHGELSLDAPDMSGVRAVLDAVLAGHAPFPKMAVYGATKAAIASLAVSLRCEVAGSGVRITELVAGRVQTELYRDVLDPRTRSEMYAAFDAVQPEDVARMLVSVLEMPPAVNVSRFDILPTAQYVGGGGFARKES